MVNPPDMGLRRDGPPRGGGSGDPMLPRKASAPGIVLPVPITDTGSQVENTKAIETIIVKELGKMPP